MPMVSPSHLPSRELLLLIGLFILPGYPWSFAQEQDETKRPQPTAQNQKEALEILQEDHHSAYETAKSDAKVRLQLAQTLLDEAQAMGKDFVGRFVRLQQAAQLAADAGDMDIAAVAIDELDRIYEKIPHEKLWKEALERAASSVEDAEAGNRLVNLVLHQITAAVIKDDFARALQLSAIAEKAARRAKDLPLVLAVRRERRGLEETGRLHKELEPVREQLKKNPENPDANQKLGEFLALYRGKWNPALFYLAQGSDPKLRQLAQRDLANPRDVVEQIKQGDDWWKLADTYEGQMRVHLRQRAVYWYELAMAHSEHFATNENNVLLKRLEERIAMVPPARHLVIGWDHAGPPGLIRTLDRQSSTVYGVAFSPDGRKVISGCVDSTATIWDARTGKMLHRLAGHRGMIWSVAYDPRGRYVFTGSWDGTIKMWDARTGKEVQQLPRNGRIADINGIAISPDGRYLLSGSDDGIVRLWDVQTGNELKQMRGHQGFVYGVAFSPDGRYAISGGNTDRMMIYWDLRTGKEIRRFQNLGGSIRSVAISPDGRTAVAAGEQQFHLWNLKTGEKIRTFTGHTSMVFGLAFSPDGRRLISGAADRTIRYWDVATGRLLQTFQGHSSTVFDLAFSPGGGRVVSGSSDNTVRLWGMPR